MREAMVDSQRGPDEVHELVRQLVEDGWSDERIVAMLSKGIQAALQEHRWEEPWMSAIESALAKIVREGSKGLIHN
jgi:hypothetical protein